MLAADNAKLLFIGGCRRHWTPLFFFSSGYSGGCRAHVGRGIGYAARGDGAGSDHTGNCEGKTGNGVGEVGGKISRSRTGCLCRGLKHSRTCHETERLQ